MKKCIVYYPFKVDRNNPSASNIRPIRFIEGFKEAGYETDVIMGYGKERRAKIQEVKRKIENGEEYDFLYTESATEPTLLTEKNHIPKYPLLDFSFFKYCKGKGIPIGLFYRDIHWRFEQYTNTVALPKRLVAYVFYYYDLLKYKRIINVLFLPSLRMKKYIPIDLKVTVVELPSGCEDMQCEFLRQSNEDILSILYVGGLSKELYNIEKLVKAVYESENCRLDICCRPGEWIKNKEYYEKYLNERIKVIHKNGEELNEIARSKDIFSLVIEPTSY